MGDQLGDDPRFAATFKLMRNKVALHRLGEGRDYRAEDDVRAFRDGVVPAIVSNLTVGRQAPTAACSRKISEASRGGSPHALHLSSSAGNGLTHFLHFAAEDGTRANLATAWLADAASLHTPVDVQSAVLATTTIAGMPLIDGVRTAARDNKEARTSAERLSAQLTPGAMRALTLIFEGMQSGRTEAALPVFRWLCGEDPGLSWRSAKGLPISPALAASMPPLLEACSLLAKIAGADGLLVLVDQQHRSVGPTWMYGHASGLLVVSGADYAPDLQRYDLPVLTRNEAESIARLVRDRHVAAYPWPNAEAVADPDLLTFLSALRWRTTRECVRSIVAHLDATLAGQDGLG